MEELARIQDSLMVLVRKGTVGGIDHTYLATSRDPDGGVVLEGNKLGLLRLSAHLVALARGSAGEHLHFDQYSELSECACPVTVLLVDDDQVKK